MKSIINSQVSSFYPGPPKKDITARHSLYGAGNFAQASDYSVILYMLHLVSKTNIFLYVVYEFTCLFILTSVHPRLASQYAGEKIAKLAVRNCRNTLYTHKFSEILHKPPWLYNNSRIYLFTQNQHNPKAPKPSFLIRP